jgi:hypothetical protein
MASATWGTPPGVSSVQTGKWVKTGKGNNATTSFALTSSFAQGDGVVIRATVLDEAGVAVPNATVVIDITGAEFHPGLTTGPSDANGIAELTWQTQPPTSGVRAERHLVLTPPRPVA